MLDTPLMLWELSVTEQRYRAVLEVMAGVPVTEVAGRYGVSRQSVHAWAHASQGSPHIGATGQLSPGYRATESVAVWLPYLGSHLATRISKAIWS